MRILSPWRVLIQRETDFHVTALNRAKEAGIFVNKDL
jgi:hypothetical protein